MPGPPYAEVEAVLGQTQEFPGRRKSPPRTGVEVLGLQNEQLLPRIVTVLSLQMLNVDAGGEEVRGGGRILKGVLLQPPPLRLKYGLELLLKAPAAQ
mgnify:CR=1 FL=1